MTISEIVVVQVEDKSSSSSTGDSNPSNTNEVLEDKGDVITIKEEPIDSSNSNTRSDDNMMAWVKIEDISLTIGDKQIKDIC